MTCECKGAGYCKRYNRDVTARMAFLCRTSEPHRELFAKHAAEAATPDTPPPLWARSISFLVALFNLARNGFETTTKEVQATRLAVCKTCPQYDKGTCRTCGCYLPLKVRFATEHCPKYKWYGVALPEKKGKKGCGCGKAKS